MRRVILVWLVALALLRPAWPSGVPARIAVAAPLVVAHPHSGYVDAASCRGGLALAEGPPSLSDNTRTVQNSYDGLQRRGS